MYKKAIASTLITLAIGSSSAWAATGSTNVINIRASIPTQEFHALPVNPDFGRAEVMNYDPVNGTLGSLRQTYNVKNTTGAINAHIDGGPTSLFNGNAAQNIALTTTFNGVELSGVSQEVVASGTATAAGTQVDLLVSAAAPTTGASGEYTASYTVVFDNVTP